MSGPRHSEKMVVDDLRFLVVPGKVLMLARVRGGAEWWGAILDIPPTEVFPSIEIIARARWEKIALPTPYDWNPE